LLGGFGIVGLVIATVGIYGVMAYVVGQRRHEIGVRIALGATRAQVISQLLRKAAALTAIGLAIGTAGTWLVSSTARAFLFQVEPTDTGPFAAALLLLATSAMTASAFPVQRAAGVDPVVALRQE
jgi:ABC-type antimicrobial peptide transport system permease subunit